MHLFIFDLHNGCSPDHSLYIFFSLVELHSVFIVSFQRVCVCLVINYLMNINELGIICLINYLMNIK